MKNKELSYKAIFAWLAMFAVAMGFLEGIVVIYLRELYYPEGFVFPLKLMDPEMVTIEWIREAATIIMLAAAGIIAGRNNLQRLMYFLFAFGVWDIFYYVALKLLIGWPASLLTWDLLFLIPVSWLGPVLAPVICSATMIFMALSIITRQEKGYEVRPRPVDWMLIFGGAAVILYTYLIDYSKLIAASGVLSAKGAPAADEKLMNMISSYVPDSYSWLLFITGEILIVAATLKILIKTYKK